MVTQSLDPFENLPRLRELVSAIAPMLPAYRFGVLSFVALLHNREKVALRARLDLCTSAPGSLKPPISTANLTAAQIPLQLDSDWVENCIRSAATGSWLPLAGEHLLKLAPRVPLAYFQGFDARYERMDSMAVEKLVISGINRHQLLGFRATEIEGEVSELGLDSLESLLRIYGLHGSDDTTLEFSPGRVAAILPESRLDRLHALVRFSLAKGIPKDRLRVNSRNAIRNATDLPLVLNGSDVNWDESGDHCVAEWEFDLPSPGILDCRVLYAGRPQANLRLEDPKCLPNPWRTVLGLVDPDLAHMEKVLSRPSKSQAREFEVAFASLLQILGVGTVHVASVSKTSDGPDIIAMTPGVVLIIECTTDLPDDDKLTKLISRSSRMRKSLEAAHRSETVIPMLVTPLPPVELAGIRQRAERKSIIVLSSVELEYAIARSKFAPDAAEILEYWRRLPLMRGFSEGLSLD